MAIVETLGPAPDFELPDDVLETPEGQVERRGTRVDWRGRDGRLLHLGWVDDPDAFHVALDRLGVKVPAGFGDWAPIG